MKSLKCLASLLLITVLSAGCVSRYPGVTNFQMGKGETKINRDKAYNVASGILIDNGFDIKMANKDLGIISTEWKKYGGINGNPPFDLYLMVKIQIKEAQGSPAGYLITVTPANKHVNRLNPAAFTERPLQFFNAESQKGYLAPDVKTKLNGYLMYENVLNKMIAALNLKQDDLFFDIHVYEEQLIDIAK